MDQEDNKVVLTWMKSLKCAKVQFCHFFPNLVKRLPCLTYIVIYCHIFDIY